ncbi:DUF6303 family protein [Streptomyces sp. NPDC058548]|uniref:DUF6303 family protein n=1 Tax=Streptomyces sp. NPDC058548 TaxID=3346545 RepID=UPI00364C5E7F
MSQTPLGAWALWLSPGVTFPPRMHTDLFTATAAGIVPSPADRTAALARLGFAPTTDSWTWDEWDAASSTNPPGATVLVGSIAVEPSVDTEPSVEVRFRPGRPPLTVRTERRDPPAHPHGPVPDGELGAVLGPEAAGWPALGLTVRHSGVADPDGTQFRVFAGHRLIGYTTASAEAPGGREYRAVDYTDREGLTYGKAVPGGLPEDPLRAEYDALRAAYKPGDREYPASPYVPRVTPDAETESR